MIIYIVIRTNRYTQTWNAWYRLFDVSSWLCKHKTQCHFWPIDISHDPFASWSSTTTITNCTSNFRFFWCILALLSSFLDFQTSFKCHHNQVTFLHCLSLFAYVIIPFIGQKSGISLLLMIILALCTCIAVWITGKVLCLSLWALLDHFIYTYSPAKHAQPKQQ